jgi:hypothetical protein
LGTTVTIQFRRKLRGDNSGNACYQSVQNFLSAHLLSKYIKIIIHKTVTLPVVLRMFNRVLRRIFGLKRDEMREGSRKLHSEELCNLYSSPSIIRIFK